MCVCVCARAVLSHLGLASNWKAACERSAGCARERGGSEGGGLSRAPRPCPPLSLPPSAAGGAHTLLGMAFKGMVMEFGCPDGRARLSPSLGSRPSLVLKD